MARSYYLPGAEHQDVEQEAMIGLWSAARDFRPEVQPNFEAFAVMCIRRRLNTKVKLANRQKHLALNTSCEIEEGGFHRAEGANPADIIEAREELQRVLSVVKNELTPLERSVLVGTLNGLKGREIAAQVGGNNTKNNEGRDRFRRVDNALIRARRKLAA